MVNMSTTRNQQNVVNAIFEAVEAYRSRVGRAPTAVFLGRNVQRFLNDESLVLVPTTSLRDSHVTFCDIRVYDTQDGIIGVGDCGMIV